MLFSYLCIAQNTISGKLTDNSGKSVSGASVILNKLGTDEIIAYDISDGKGMYNIDYNSKEKELNIQVKSMGFATISETISNKSQVLDFFLDEETIELDEIIVKASPIYQRGDTLNYVVRNFAKEQDRTIADALKRMPGIDVLDDGRVLYQGNPINKYYVENMDMMGGRYGIINENLAHKEVARVQVLENHQPVKILDSLVYSDKAALNIQLKNKYTITGQLEAGLGASPLLREVNLTPMLFAKSQQMLMSYQSNNTGKDVSRQLRALTLEDVLEQMEIGTQKQDWLSIQSLSPPRFSEKRWRDNNINLLSVNYLQKLKKDYELKFNVSYLNDYQQQKGYSNTQYYTPNDTITLLETKYNQLYFNSLRTNLSLEKNTRGNFLKNNLEFQGFWDGRRGNIMKNKEAVTQSLSNQFFRVSNKFKTIFPLGKQLVTLNSYIGFNQTPQTLKVNPGQFQDLLNSGNQYDDILQEINLKTLYTNNFISFTKGINHFTFTPKIGFQLEHQNLYSEIQTSDNQVLGDEFTNNLEWKKYKLYAEVKSEYKKNKWKFGFNLPVSLNSYALEDKSLDKKQDINEVKTSPQFSVNYDIDAFWKINSSLGINHTYGTINQLHYAYILQNYRNIQRVDTPLPQTLNNSLSAGILYKNPIKSLFFNLFYSLTNSENNLLYDNKILENGAFEIQAIKQKNFRKSHNFSSRISKYSSYLKTNFTFNGNYNFGNFQQIINTEKLDVRNNNWSFGTDIETDFTDWFSAEYSPKLMFSKNKILSKDNPTISRQTHLLSLNFYPRENQYLGLKAEYVKSNLISTNTENYFADLVYRYTFKKKKLDLELSWNNIFNNSDYKTFSIDGFSYIENNYKLRPSQVLLKLRISL